MRCGLKMERTAHIAAVCMLVTPRATQRLSVSGCAASLSSQRRYCSSRLSFVRKVDVGLRLRRVSGDGHWLMVGHCFASFGSMLNQSGHLPVTIR